MKITINTTTTSVEQDDIEEIVNRIKLLLEIEGYARDTIEGYFTDLDAIDEADAYTVHDELEKLKTDYDVLNANTAKIIEQGKADNERLIYENGNYRDMVASKNAEINKMKGIVDSLNDTKVTQSQIISELKERLNEPCPNHCNACLKNTHGVVGDSGLRFITNTKFPENKG